MRDLIVAGGGPVGLATALHAARAGLEVTVMEPREGDIDKACGEGLMPGAVAALTRLGIPLDGHRIEGIRYLDGSRSAEARFRHGDGLGVRRTTLHRAMREVVADAGVETVHVPVRTAVDRGDHVLVDGHPARYLVAADGLHSPVRRMVGLDGPAATSRRFGLRCHVDVAPWTSFVEVHWTPTCEAYVTPVSDVQVGIAVLCTDGRGPHDVLDALPALAARVGDRPRSRVRGAGPLRQRVQRRVAGRVLLVGDAAGYVDALTGEGIALGMAQAKAAVAGIVSDDVSRYDADVRRLGRRHQLLTLGLLKATRSATVRRHVVRTASVLPGVFGLAVDQLARPA